MAEVPEVETLVRDMRAALIGRMLIDTEVLQPAAVRWTSVDELTRLLAAIAAISSNRRVRRAHAVECLSPFYGSVDVTHTTVPPVSTKIVRSMS